MRSRIGFVCLDQFTLKPFAPRHAAILFFGHSKAMPLTILERSFYSEAISRSGDTRAMTNTQFPFALINGTMGINHGALIAALSCQKLTFVHRPIWIQLLALATKLSFLELTFVQPTTLFEVIFTFSREVSMLEFTLVYVPVGSVEDSFTVK